MIYSALHLYLPFCCRYLIRYSAGGALHRFPHEVHALEITPSAFQRDRQGVLDLFFVLLTPDSSSFRKHSGPTILQVASEAQDTCPLDQFLTRWREARDCSGAYARSSTVSKFRMLCFTKPCF